MHRQSKRCHNCYVVLQSSPERRLKLSIARKGKPSYERTPEIREKERRAHLGKSNAYPSASTRPEVAQKIRDWWTPERREQRRQENLERNKDPQFRLRYGRPGMLNPNFLNGQSVVPYESGWLCG